jgi:glycosyltransferase involved in cell wall biosynthesis
LHFARLYYPVIGGCERDTRELTIELAKMGHDLTILTSDVAALGNFKRNKYVEKIPPDDKGVKTIRLHAKNISSFRTFIQFLHLLTENARRIGLVRSDSLLSIDALHYSGLIPAQYVDSVGSGGFNVVNGTQIGHGELFFLQKICKKSRVPFVFTPRTHTLDPNTGKILPLALKIASASDAIIVLTMCEKEYYVKEGIEPNKIFVTGIGVRPEAFDPPSSNFFRSEYGIPNDHSIVLHIARMEKYKGAELLIKSMRTVWMRKANATLVLIGKSTPYTKKIKQIAQTEKRIVVLPDASEKIKKEALFEATLLVNPSQIESFGGVFLEAWAAAKPVIGAKTPVSDCVVTEGKDGLLLENLDEAELAKKILFLLENEQVAHEMGKNGKNKALSDYSWEKIAKLTLEVYDWVQDHRVL